MKKILVALDGSPRADGVLAYAVSFAELINAQLVLLRSFALPPAMPAHVWALADDSLADALRHDAEAYVGTLAERVPPRLLAKKRVDLGVPWQAVCAAAQEENVDLVVIGSHGFSGLDHLLGTTAAKIVNHIDRPILVVRPVPTPEKKTE